MSKKPSYVALENLLKKWRTDLHYGSAEGKIHFRAFYGTYAVSYERAEKKI